MEEQALLAWLRASVAAAGHDISGLTSIQQLADGRVLAVHVEHCFPAFLRMPGIDNLAFVTLCVQQHYPSITSSDGLFGLCKGLLAASVLQSDAAEAQQSIFMSLSPEYQAAMQGMLEDVASASANDSGINASTCFSPASVAHAARDTTSITTLQRENKLLKEEVASLTAKVRQLSSELESTIGSDSSDAAAGSRKDGTHATLLSALDQLDAARARERDLEAQIAHKVAQITRMQEVIDAMQADCREVAALRDELDVLRPAATKLNKAEATNARLAKQVADMDELAAQLETLKCKMSDSVALNVKLQHEVSAIPSLKERLEAYRAAKCEAEANCSDLRNAVASLTAKLGTSTTEIASLKSQLQDCAQQESVPLAAAGPKPSSAALGRGVTAFNPEISERLARLEAENKQLTEQQCSAATEKLVDLEHELEDMRRLKETFERKYSVATATIEDLQSQLEEHQSANRRLVEELRLKSAELVGELERGQTMKASLEQRCSRLDSLLEGKRKEASDLSKQLHDAESQLEEKSADLIRIRQEKTVKEQALEQKLTELHQNLKESAAQYESRKRDLDAALAAKTADMDGMNRELHSALDTIEKGRGIVLAAQSAADAAMTKLRKAEAERDEAVCARMAADAKVKRLTHEAKVDQERAAKEKSREDELLTTVQIMRAALLQTGLELPGQEGPSAIAAATGVTSGDSEVDFIESIRMSDHNASVSRKKVQQAMLQLSAEVIKSAAMAKENEELKHQAEELKRKLDAATLELTRHEMKQPRAKESTPCTAPPAEPVAASVEPKPSVGTGMLRHSIVASAPAPVSAVPFPAIPTSGPSSEFKPASSVFPFGGSAVPKPTAKPPSGRPSIYGPAGATAALKTRAPLKPTSIPAPGKAGALPL